MWQVTSQGILTGYPSYLDLDYAFMSRDAWALYANPDGGAGHTVQLPTMGKLHTFEDDDMKVTVEVKR